MILKSRSPGVWVPSVTPICVSAGPLGPSANVPTLAEVGPVGAPSS